jgi:hypothetical protein
MQLIAVTFIKLSTSGPHPKSQVCLVLAGLLVVAALKIVRLLLNY